MLHNGPRLRSHEGPEDKVKDFEIARAQEGNSSYSAQEGIMARAIKLVYRALLAYFF